ncbi:MAG: DMT family transporter [Planctomycetota bacterium]
MCMVLAVTSFSGMAVCVKLLGPEMPSHQKILVRSVAAVPVLLWMLRRRRLSPWGHQPWLLFARGAMGFVGMLAYFVSIAHLPIGTAVMLTHASPIFSAWFASRFLGERAGRAVWIASAVCLAGVALVARPTEWAAPLYISIALGSAVLNGATYTTVRHATRTEDPLAIVLWLPLVCLPITAVMTAFDYVVPNAAEWWLLIAMSALSIVAQIFMTMGFQRETASRATNVFFLGVVLALAWQPFLDEAPLSLLDLLGAVLVVGGILGLAAARGRGPTLGRMA